MRLLSRFVRTHRRLVALVAASAATVVVGALSGASAAAPAWCSKATANRVLAAHGYRAEGSLPITYNVLCGAFLGPGSRAMVATINHGACWPIVGWAVIAHQRGAWRLVSRGDNRLFLEPFVADGDGFRETQRVFAKDDTGCNPTSGTLSRTWHWNGRRFVPTAWTRNYAHFTSPDRKLWCNVSEQPSQASCGSANYVHSAIVTGSGKTTICNDPVNGCWQNFINKLPILAAGRVQQLYGFRCSATATSVTCVVASGAGAGRGFTISNDTAANVTP
jgi:hypothetical protein